MTTRSVIFESKISVSSLNSQSRVGTAKRVTRSMDNYRTVIQKLATLEVFPEFTIDTFFEIISDSPIELTITPEGGTAQVFNIHNYFAYTPPSGEETTLQIKNIHTADNEVRMFIS